MKTFYSKWNYLSGISRVFTHMSTTLQACYELYANNYSSALKLLHNLENTSPGFRKFLENAQQMYSFFEYLLLLLFSLLIISISISISDLDQI